MLLYYRNRIAIIEQNNIHKFQTEGFYGFNMKYKQDKVEKHEKVDVYHGLGHKNKYLLE